MCAGCPHRGLFYSLKKRKCTVLGDIGCYTLGAVPPLSTIELTLCMGASIGATHGFNKMLGAESEGKTVAVIGDSTFIHSGITGLVDAVYNKANVTVIILDNRTTGMTGHQNNPANGKNIHNEPTYELVLPDLAYSLGVDRVRCVDPYDLKEFEKTVKEELEAEGVSVIISERPCVLLTKKLYKGFVVDETKCRNCKSCMKLGCPAISSTEKGVKIDTSLCTECGLCQNVCAFDAIKG